MVNYKMDDKENFFWKIFIGSGGNKNDNYLDKLQNGKSMRHDDQTEKTDSLKTVL